MKRQRRIESNHATNRKRIGLAELKLVDMIKTGDKVTFAYNGQVFRAAISREANLIDETSGTIFVTPTAWTNACVQTYCRARGTDCKTNPSGFDRVRHESSGVPLNILRDRYMATYNLDLTVKTPVEISTANAAMKHKSCNQTSVSTSDEWSLGPASRDQWERRFWDLAKPARILASECSSAASAACLEIIDEIAPKNVPDIKIPMVRTSLSHIMAQSFQLGKTNGTN